MVKRKTVSDAQSASLQRLTTLPTDPDLVAEGGKWLGHIKQALLDKKLPEMSALLEESLHKACCCSNFIGKTLLAHPEWLEQECVEAKLRVGFSEERFDSARTTLESAANDDEFMRELRLLRQREMVRIALRDLFAWSDLNETLFALSVLAEFCIQQAHCRAYNQQCLRYGKPYSEKDEEQSLVILAMGKLGGRELNYSSDIDLIFTYPETGYTRTDTEDQRKTDNQSFFIAQAQLLIKYLNDTTADGIVFRVDTRLRPFGESGALVVSYQFMESYYQHQGREWERYAMIKAHAVCGKPAHRDQLEHLLQPFVYRRYLDYGAFTALRDMKALIMREVERKSMQGNVKLGPGGIREIEFTGQAFQLIRGGRDPDLRNRQILTVLEKLGDRAVIDQHVVQALKAAYRFLRDTENRLQMVEDYQTHSLPQTSLGRMRLAYAMGFADWQQFSTELEHHRDAVRDCFQEIFFAHTETEGDQPDHCQLAMQQLLDGKLDNTDAINALRECGYEHAEFIIKQLNGLIKSNAFRHVTPLARKHLGVLLPTILVETFKSGDYERTLTRVLGFLQAIMQRPVYLTLLVEYPGALTQMIRLFAASGWIADYLARQPILLDSFLDTAQLYSLPSRDELLQQLKQLIHSQEKEDQEQRLNALRHFKQEQILRVAAVDVNERLPLMKVSDQLTWLAEAILDQVRALSKDELASKYGQPVYRLEGSEQHAEMAVIAYGKLGGTELGYASDLDIVLLHNSTGDAQQTNGKSVVDNPTYFARLAQRLVYWLTTPTLAGVLYETDLRLRPDGASGMMVSSLERFQQYQQERAWIWEHQALVRARLIVGSESIRKQFEDIRHIVLCKQRDHKQLRKEVRDMRERMRQEVAKSRADEFDLKFDRGGLGDIEFLVQYAVLAWAYKYPHITRFTDNIRILEQFRTLDLFTNAEINCLTEGYLQLRAQIHQRALNGEAAVIDDTDVARDYVDRVGEIWCKYMEVED